MYVLNTAPQFVPGQETAATHLVVPKATRHLRKPTAKLNIMSYSLLRKNNYFLAQVFKKHIEFVFKLVYFLNAVLRNLRPSYEKKIKQLSLHLNILCVLCYAKKLKIMLLTFVK